MTQRSGMLPTLLFALALVCAPYAVSADPAATVLQLPQLMAWMQSVRRSSASFVEQRFVQMLRQPLQSSGRLLYVAPDKLQKETLAPTKSALIVDGDHMTVEQPDGKMRDLSLSEIPELGALVESIRATLAGDPATLDRFYVPTLTGTANDWSLQLEPRDPRLRKMLTLIRIQGDGTSIRSVETIERDGDRTDMTITPDPG